MKVAKKNPVMRFIQSVEEAPKWMIDNLHLKGGYRVGYTSIKSNIRALFVRHNDVMNIWTHLVGAVFFAVVLIYLIVSSVSASGLYSELKTDIASLGVTEKIRESYDRNVEPLLRGLRENRQQLESVDWAVMRGNLIERVKRAEAEYMEALTELGARFQDSEVSFLRKFETSYDSFVKNLGILKNNLTTRVSAMSQLSMDKLADLVEDLDSSLNVDDIITKLGNAVKLDVEIYPVLIYVVCAIVCLGMSAVYHTFYVMSPQIDKLLHRFDMAGINILIFGSVYAVMHYFLYCRPITRAVYLTGSFVSCFAVFVVSMGHAIHKPENIKLKGLLFGGLGVSNVIPMVHVCYLGMMASQFDDNVPANSVMLGLLLMGALYLTGLTFYTFKLPERLYPQTFDIWLNSHVVWHIFVFLAAAVHLYNVVMLYSIRKTIPCLAWL